MTKLISKVIIAASAAAILTASASAAGNGNSAEARIPFTSSIRDFRADGREAIYVQDVHRQWYRGTFFAPCFELPFANTIGFSNRGIGGLDKWATIYVRGDRCNLHSFVKSDPPTSERHGRKARTEMARPSGLTA